MNARNVGRLDALVRGVAGVGAFLIALLPGGALWVSLAAAAAAVYLVATALTRSCPIYRIVGFHTTDKNLRRS